MALSAIDVTTGLLSYAVVTDKASLIKLLERNGISMPQNASDREVTTAVLMASGKSLQIFSQKKQNLLPKNLLPLRVVILDLRVLMTLLLRDGRLLKMLAVICQEHTTLT